MSHSEEMKFFNQIVSVAWKKSSDVATSLQRQAPGARMIGEFAVKQFAKEAEKIADRISGRQTSSTQK
jgi:leucyl aminopeptidase (aminopeptidase T)